MQRRAKRPPRPRTKPLLPKYPNSDELPARIPRSHFRQAEQLVDPDKYPYSVMLPDINSKNRCTRKFTKSFTIASTDGGCSNGFRLAVLPSADSPIVYSGPDTNIPAIPGPYRVSGRAFISSTNFEHSTLRVDDGTNTALCQLQPITDSGAKTLYGIYASNTVSAVTTDARLSLTAVDSKHSLPLVLTVYQMRAGVWVAISKVTVPRKEYVDYSMAAAAGTAIGFELDASNTSVHQLEIQFSVASGSSGQVGGKALYDMTRGTLLNDLRGVAQYVRLTGLSLLITNTSAEIARNGNIYTARVPHRQSAFSAASTLQKDVIDMYHGDAAHGSYVWWLPGENSTRTMTDLAEYSDQLDTDTILWASVDGWGGVNTSSVQVTVTACVEFYALSQLYEKIPPPIDDPGWERTMGVLARMPSASCNPMHKELLRNLIDRGKDAYSKVSGHYIANKQLYDALAAILLG